jgi:ACR3 family arsenite efflux pump ArsB
MDIMQLISFKLSDSFAYRVVVYFALFGLAGEPYLELVPRTSAGRMKVFQDKTGTYRTSFFLPGSSPCPENVRQESQLLRADFNMRLKQVGFNSLCSAYYTAFIPCVFITVRNFK